MNNHQNDNIEICMCMDLDFVKPSLIAIKSIISNSSVPSNNIRFNLVIPPETTNIITNIISKNTSKNTSKTTHNIKYRLIEFHLPNTLDPILQKMKRHKLVKKLKCFYTATNYLNYSRYYLHYLFPDLNKIIYIDGDVIVQGDILELYQTNFSNPNQIYFGAVDGYANTLKYFNYCHSIKIPQIQKHKTKIFNAGIYITLLNKWRQNNIDKVLEEWICNNISDPNQLLYYCGTEPPLKLVFSESNRLKIPTKWNYIHKWENKYNKHMKLKYQDAAMIHFKGARKPWRNECKSKWNKLWQEYACL